MKSGRAEILTGLLVLVTIVVGMVFLIMLGRGALFGSGVRYVAYLANSADLKPATAVHFEGQRVGRVESVEWDPGRRAYQITLRVPAQVPVRADSEVRLRSVKLMGGMFVEVSAGTPAAPLATDGSELVAAPFKALAEGIGQLTQGFEPVLAELSQTLEALRRAFRPDGALGDIEATMKSIRSAATKLDAGASDLQIILGASDEGLRGVTTKMNRLLDENAAPLRESLADTGAAARSLKRMAGEAEEPVREIVASAKRLVQALEATAGKLDATIGQLETGVGEVAAAATGALDHARRLLRENESDIRAVLLAARAATENLQRAAAKIADRPSTLLFDSEDETSKAARERRDFERLLRDRGRANRHGKE